MYAHPRMKYTYVGVDSHKHSHTAVFLSCFHEKLGEITLSTIPSEFPKFLEDARKYRLEGTSLAFGFEDTSTYGRSIIKFLLEENQLVKHVNSSLVASERRSQNALHKTDSVDAECAARILLNRFDQLPMASSDDQYFILKTLVSRRHSVTKIKAMLQNHLHSLLFDHYPSYNTFWAHIDCKSSLAFYEEYPSPSMLMGSTLEELTTFFISVTGGKSGEKKKATQIWNTVKQEGVRTLDNQQTRDFTIQSTVRQLKLSIEETDTIDGELEKALDNFDYPLLSMRGIDVVVATKLIAEIGDIDRFRNASALAKYAGVAPVTYASGQSNVQYANRRGNRNLNETIYRLAINLVTLKGTQQSILNPFFYEYYHKKISEGKTKRQALKCVQRRLINLIYGIMKHKEAYINPPVGHPEKHNIDNSNKHQATFQ